MGRKRAKKTRKVKKRKTYFDFRKEEKESPTVKFFRREFDVDLIEEYKKLKDIGALSSEDLKDRHKLNKAINKAGKNAVMAGIIFRKARKQRELFRVKYYRTMRELTRLAISRVQTWLESVDVPKKAITKDMVTEEIMAKKDTRKEYEALIREQEELREIRDNLELIMKQWTKRGNELQTQVGLLKAEKHVVLGK